MTPIILGIAGPLLGLLGVVLGIWYGQRHWRRERDERQGDFYRARRQEAYTGLWEVVQDAHLRMRASLTRGLDDFSVFLTDVNSFAWKRGLYVDDIDRELAQEYLFLVYEFLQLVAKNEAAKHWVVTSASLPDDTPSTLTAMKVAEDEANVVRDRLAERIRVALGAAPEESSQTTGTDGQVLATRFQALIRRELERPLDFWPSSELISHEQVSAPEVDNGEQV
jgi:hypothetical protein